MTDALNTWATWREIKQQPKVWRGWAAQLDVDGLRGWIADQTYDEVWFCGAGTSAYIGDIIAAEVRGTRAVATTDIVADPTRMLQGRNPLVVNFGRSGNSAETIGTLNALDAIAPNAPRLNMTCNGQSELATRQGSGPSKTIVLPDVTHDEGFAMTSSFSTMLLTALALFDAPCDAAGRMRALADQLDNLLPQLGGAERPERVVYVGAGPLTYAAREAALKVMELSAGQIPAVWDSVLGFRHGPKAFVTDATAITVFTSPQEPTKSYDRDLVAELRSQFPNAKTTAIGPDGDIDIAMPFGPAWAAALCVAVSQVSGVIWSHDLGLNVDDPFKGQNTLSRVVAGVKLYPVAS